MKVSEIDRSAYACEAFSVITPHCTANFPEGGWDAVLRLYGDCELAQDGLSVTESGYLVITVQKEPERKIPD